MNIPLFIFSFIFSTSFAFLQLDYSHQGQQIYTCEIDGFVDQNVHQLHGTLVNCQSPEMECSVESDEYLVKSRTNIHCRIPSDDLFLHDDKLCSFRYYYRRSYCFDNSRCYSLTMSCHAMASLTFLSWSLIIVIILLSILVICFVCYCIYECFWRTTDLNIPKQDKKLEKVRRQSQKLKEKEPKMKNSYLMETTF